MFVASLLLRGKLALLAVRSDEVTHVFIYYIIVYQFGST